MTHFPSKKTGQKSLSHAQHRALERYGVVLTHADVEDIVEQIKRADGAVFLERHAHGAQLWEVIFREMPMRLIFAPSIDAIMTFVPPSATR